MKAHPENPNARLMLSSLLLDAGRKAEAEGLARALVKDGYRYAPDLMYLQWTTASRTEADAGADTSTFHGLFPQRWDNLYGEPVRSLSGGRFDECPECQTEVRVGSMLVDARTGEITYPQFTETAERMDAALSSRFLSVDPIASQYPHYSPYQFAGNQPIWAIDRDGLEELIIHLKQLAEVGGTAITVPNAKTGVPYNVIAYRVTFSIRFPDGREEVLNPGRELVVFENKYWQSNVNAEGYGNLSANALKQGQTYNLKWQKLGNYNVSTAENSLHIESSGSGHSNLTYIHPSISTTELLGCKGICFLEDITFKMVEGGWGIGGETAYNLQLYDPSKKLPGTSKYEDYNTGKGRTLAAAGVVRQLYLANLNRLQPGQNLKLSVGTTATNNPGPAPSPGSVQFASPESHQEEPNVNIPNGN